MESQFMFDFNNETSQTGNLPDMYDVRQVSIVWQYFWIQGCNLQHK